MWNKLKEHYERQAHRTVLIFSAKVAYCWRDNKYTMFRQKDIYLVQTRNAFRVLMGTHFVTPLA
jgi:hypothetical protein